MDVLWLKAQQLGNERIAAIADVSTRQLQRILNLFDEHGLEGVRAFHESGQVSELTQYQPQLAQEFLEHPVRSISQACARIEEVTGIRRKLTQVRAFLKNKLGLRWRKVAAIPLPPKKSKEEQATIQADWLRDQLYPRVAQALSGERRLLFCDAAHFVLSSELGSVWSATRLYVRAASGRQRYNVLGAIEPLTQDMFRVTNTLYINADVVCELLRHIREQDPRSAITIVLDNASYQRCEKVQNLARQLDLDLLFLPSYSPNLNLIERVWKFIRQTALSWPDKTVG